MSSLFRHRHIKARDLPLILIGREEDTYRNVYELTGLLNIDLCLSLKYNGYIQSNEVRLQTGEIVEGVWIKCG